ncbi:metal ABC transporter solute-binding protein, Zn/Mn family [Neobacillus niacini]|uniref:metal ABC transporter solute-binding protein, Zn/Mn family n=1 Tax=Neobacillus niacini TaxID=86668 RepID=UPI0028558F3B|nr:zinc ABC transporter substrate-binding protein [Neobacillus niacini]MDR7000460.1 zinc transport system substrate-binding protein [Neobacillus niacini]
MKKIILFLSILIPFSLLLAGCAFTNNPSQKKKGQLTVYTTVFPLQYFTEQIGGKYVNVKTIYPPGADEHTFEPSQKDMMNLADSDLFFYIGLGLEGFVEKAKTTLQDENVTLVAVADHLQLPKDQHADEADEDGQHHGDVNPHVWLDPIYSKEMAGVIKDSLVKKMPQHKALFEKNYQKLAKQLDDLNKRYQQTIKNAPHKEMIVTHAAFGYWENRYGLKQISISGLSTTNEPTQKELEKIISLADREGLHYILFEQNVHSKLGEIVQNEIGAKALPIHNLAILTEDNIKNKETYFTLMNKNLATLKTALAK